MIEDITDSAFEQFGMTPYTVKMHALLTFLIAVQIGRADAAQQIEASEKK